MKEKSQISKPSFSANTAYVLKNLLEIRNILVNGLNLLPLPNKGGSHVIKHLNMSL